MSSCRIMSVDWLNASIRNKNWNKTSCLKSWVTDIKLKISHQVWRKIVFQSICFRNHSAIKIYNQGLSSPCLRKEIYIINTPTNLTSTNPIQCPHNHSNALTFITQKTRIVSPKINSMLKWLLKCQKGKIHTYLLMDNPNVQISNLLFMSKMPTRVLKFQRIGNYIQWSKQKRRTQPIKNFNP